MKIKVFKIVLVSLVLVFLTACNVQENNSSNMTDNKEEENMETTNLSGIVPDELAYIPDDYYTPVNQQGTLNKLTYQTWESFSYEEHSQPLTEEAWVYLPANYDANRQYNIFYLSHGGWSNETTIMGTEQNPTSFKNVIDHAIEDGKM